MQIKNTKNPIIAVFTALLLAFSASSAMAEENSELNILVSHPQTGTLEICIDSKGYEDLCDEFDLQEFMNPFTYSVDVEDPEEGKTFEVCHTLDNDDQKTCEKFRFSGDEDQTITINANSYDLADE